MSLIEGDEAEPGASVPKHRRRGADLETVLLDATWAEFRAVGFNDLTLEAVAQRAGTSRAVLYRRWPGKVEMVAAAARRAIQRDRGPAPQPTGSLREDLLALLRWANRSDVGALIEATQSLGAFLAAEGLTFADIRNSLVRGGASVAFSPIDLAIARGEVDPEIVTPRVMSLAFDLFRHEVILNGQLPSDQTLCEIVDEVVVPLLTGRSGRAEGDRDRV